MLAVVVLGSAVDVLVARHLRRALDRTLRARAVEVAQLAASAPALLTAPGALDSPVGGDAGAGRGRRPARPDRRALAVARRPRAADARSRATAIATARGALRGRASSAATSVRVYAAPLATTAVRRPAARCVVAASTADVEDTLAHAARL